MEYHSLSWFKKRTAALNKALGTSYSPTDLYRNQSGARGSSVRDALEAMGDPRSARGGSNVEAAAHTFLMTQWSAFAGRDAFAHAIVGAADGGWISEDFRTVYMQDARGNWLGVSTETGALTRVEGLPAGSTPLSPSRVSRLLAARARQVKAYRERHGDKYPPVTVL